MSGTTRLGTCGSCGEPTSKRGDLLCSRCWLFVPRSLIDRFMQCWRAKHAGDREAAKRIVAAEAAIVARARKELKAAA